MQRIVIPIIMLEHFQAFTWDRLHWVDHHNQPSIHHRVYNMTSMPPEMITLDVNAQRNLVQEFDGLDGWQSCLSSSFHPRPF